MDPLTVLAIAKQCASAAPALVVAALALMQTDGNANAVMSAAGDAGSFTVEEALQAASSAQTNAGNPAIGMALVPAYEFTARSLSMAQGLGACTNLRVAAELVGARYVAIGGTGDADWRRAAIDFGVGDLRMDPSGTSPSGTAPSRTRHSGTGHPVTGAAGVHQGDPRARRAYGVRYDAAYEEITAASQAIDRIGRAMARLAPPRDPVPMARRP